MFSNTKSCLGILILYMISICMCMSVCKIYKLQNAIYSELTTPKLPPEYSCACIGMHMVVCNKLPDAFFGPWLCYYAVKSIGCTVTVTQFLLYWFL